MLKRHGIVRSQTNLSTTQARDAYMQVIGGEKCCSSDECYLRFGPSWHIATGFSSRGLRGRGGHHKRDVAMWLSKDRERRDAASTGAVVTRGDKRSKTGGSK